MNKKEFLDELKQELSGFPEEDVKERLAFFEEMIEDGVEEWLSESEAVKRIGSAKDVAAQIVAETPLTKLVKQKIKPKRTLRAWEIVLIALGSPLWFPLLVSAFAVALSLYVVVWSLVLVVWAVEISLWTGAFYFLLTSLIYIFTGNTPAGVASLGAGVFLIGASIFAFYACKNSPSLILKATKRAARAVKLLFIKKNGR